MRPRLRPADPAHWDHDRASTFFPGSSFTSRTCSHIPEEDNRPARRGCSAGWEISGVRMCAFDTWSSERQHMPVAARIGRIAILSFPTGSSESWCMISGIVSIRRHSGGQVDAAIQEPADSLPDLLSGRPDRNLTAYKGRSPGLPTPYFNRLHSLPKIRHVTHPVHGLHNEDQRLASRLSGGPAGAGGCPRGPCSHNTGMFSGSLDAWVP